MNPQTPMPEPESDKKVRAISESPRDAWRNERDGAGCLVILGVLSLVVVLPAMSAIAWENLWSAFNALQWTDGWAFLKSAWQWLRYGTSGDRYTPYIWMFGLGYCFLVWQWIAFLIGWRILFSSHRLWAVSSAYFTSLLFVIGFFTYEGSDSLPDWLMVTLLYAMLPGTFLAITLPLWLLRPRATKEAGSANGARESRKSHE